MANDLSYLKKMRTGQPPHSVVTLGNKGDSFNVAVVLLSNDEMLNINEMVEERYPNMSDQSSITQQKVRALFYNRLLCYYCTRIPEDLGTKIASDPDEIGKLLDDEDIQRICEQYNNLLINKAPKLEVLTEEELDSLKKYLEVTPLKDISTVSLVHLKYCHQTLVSEQCLTSNGSGSSSISE